MSRKSERGRRAIVLTKANRGLDGKISGGPQLRLGATGAEKRRESKKGQRSERHHKELG